MATNKIYHVSDLPKWFSLSKYEATSAFTVDDWVSHIDHRLDFNWELRPECRGHNHRGAGYQHMLSQFESIKENPTQPIINPERLVEENDIETRGESAFVKPLRCGMAHYIATDIESVYGLNEDEDLGLAGNYSVIRYFKDHDAYMSSLVPVVVDLTGSDIDIMKDFRICLERARAFVGEENKKTNVKPSDIDKLQKYNLLPYFDLMIWSTIAHQKISANVILSALFDSDDEAYKVGESFIAQTLKPFYQKINTSFVRALKCYK